MLHLPVTCQGPAVAGRQNLLRREYDIPPRARIAIHLGGANPYCSSLEIAEAFSTLPDWYLLFQGNHLRGFAEKIRNMARRKGARNVIVSKSFFTHLHELEKYLQSADVGIAWYNDLNANFRSAGRSSGKIASYLKFGLPVVANRHPSTEEALAETGCGICVSGMEEISAALDNIVANYDYFSANARQEYERHYRFENYHHAILRFLELA